jgi:hypothetical protein
MRVGDCTTFILGGPIVTKLYEVLTSDDLKGVDFLLEEFD